jgi:hypothetical protein
VYSKKENLGHRWKPRDKRYNLILFYLETYPGIADSYPVPKVDFWNFLRTSARCCAVFLPRMARIAELWVYHGESVPRTVKLKSARVTNTGFELDRAFCVVDTKGSMVWKGEAISLLSVLYRRSSPPSMWR